MLRTWNGAIWRWNGWSWPVLVLVSVHSSTVPRVAGFGKVGIIMLNSLPLIQKLLPPSSLSTMLRDWAMGSADRSGSDPGSGPAIWGEEAMPDGPPVAAGPALSLPGWTLTFMRGVLG